MVNGTCEDSREYRRKSKDTTLDRRRLVPLQGQPPVEPLYCAEANDIDP